MSTVISLSQVTEGKVNGEGSLDKLLEALSSQLLVHLRKDDINSAQFAEIYAASLNPIMQQAIQFTLNKPKIEADTDLVIKQHEKVDAEIQGVLKNNELIDKQIVKMDAEIVNIGFQNDLLEKQLDKIDQDILLTQEQILNSQVERKKMEKEVEILGLQYQVVEQQVQESKAKVELVREQVKLTTQQTLKTVEETALIAQQAINAAEELGLLAAQKSRTEQETILMSFKVITERAQTEDNIDGIVVAGAIGRKNLLMLRQANAFKRDSEQKTAKIMSDLWSLQKSAEPGNTFIGMIAGETEKWEAADPANPLDGGYPVPAVDSKGVPQNMASIKAAIDKLIAGLDEE